jgi:hypothetical protein
MAKLTQTDKLRLEKLFEMGGGYVLNFSNSSFQQLIFNTIKIDLYNHKYDFFGDSKAKRLRAIWQIESDYNVGLLIKEMLEYWNTNRLINGPEISENEKAIFSDCTATSNRLLGKKDEEIIKEEDFLKKEFTEISFERLKIDSAVIQVLEERIKEIKKGLKNGASLSVVFMCGSVLEGILLGTSLSNMKKFNQSTKSPKDKKTGKVLQFQDWTLNSLIDVAHEVGLLGLDVKKYSHSLRDFRNYIHPYQQMSSGFSPDRDTAKICWQVLRAAISDLCK